MKFTPAVRLAHLAAAVLTAILLVTGARLLWLDESRYLPERIRGGLDLWAPEGMVHQWHVSAGKMLLLVGLFYLVYLFITKEWRRLAGTDSENRYGPTRMVLYNLILISLGVGIVSGLILFSGNFGSGSGLTFVRWLHYHAALVVLFMSVIHILAVTVSPVSHVNGIFYATPIGPGYRFTETLLALLAALLMMPLLRTLITDPPTLHCSLQNRTVIVDGKESDIEWMGVDEVILPVMGGANFDNTVTEVRVKSFHNRHTVYFLLTWEDHTRSFNRHLEKTNGGWVRLTSERLNPAGESVYWEDQAALSLHADPDGCMGCCHAGGPVGRGRHYTKGDTADVWYWKAVSTNPAWQAEDGWWGDDVGPGLGGIHIDNLAAGGYHDNLNEQWGQPYLLPLHHTQQHSIDITSNLYFPYRPEDDTFSVGATAPGVVVAPMIGDAADVRARGRWRGGTWTLEIARRRATGSASDLIFRDELYLGVAVFDNAEKQHAYHVRPVRLVVE